MKLFGKLFFNIQSLFSVLYVITNESQGLISNLVVTKIINLWKTMVPLHMPVPTTEMLLTTSNEFSLKWNIPNCVGSIDGKYTRLKCPSNSGSMYGFGGLVVSVLASGSRVCGKPLDFSVFRKIHSTPSYGGEVK
jgi:hypothetical protein